MYFGQGARYVHQLMLITYYRASNKAEIFGQSFFAIKLLKTMESFKMIMKDSMLKTIAKSQQNEILMHVRFNTYADLHKMPILKFDFKSA